jgi:integrase
MNSYQKVLKWSLDNELTTRNPFAGLAMKKKKIDCDWLETDEMTALESYAFASPSLDRVRDFFVFCAYTGLSFIDYDSLKNSDVQTIINPHNGTPQQWIIKQRQKGETQNYGDFSVPIFSPALTILQKYGSVEELPRMANQVFNRLLKECGAILGQGLEGDRLHCHLARHSFIWWALNVKCLSRESVARMVGHSDTKMLNQYAPIGIQRIQNDLGDMEL